MHRLAAKVAHSIARRALAPAGARIVAAISGGADSTAMLHLLYELADARVVTLAGAAHFNHRLRGDEADADERFCRDLAADLSLPIVVEAADVADIARAEKRSIEDAARRLRYDFLGRAAEALSADRVAVGHTRDDQAETVLLRLFRGAGARGLSAIRPRRGVVIRPLIDLGRQELREYLTDGGWAHREDASNADRHNPRNRVRHDLMPLLESSFSPGIVHVLARTADIAAEDAAWLEGKAAARARKLIVAESPGVWTIDAEALAQEPPALGRRVAAMALHEASGGLFVGFDHIDRLLEVAAGHRRAMQAPRVRAERISQKVVLYNVAAGRRQPPGIAEVARTQVLPIPGSAEVLGLDGVISAEDVAEPHHMLHLSGSGDETIVDRAMLAEPLSVRAWRPGDRFRPLGLGGRRKKLQDLFTDRKVPRSARARAPIVVDARDRIVWVAGVAVAEDFRVTQASNRVVILKFRKSGGRV